MKKIICVLAISLFISLIFVLLTKEPMMPDSYGYDAIARNISAGTGYAGADGAFTMEREPAYPLFLAAIYYFLGHNYFFVQLFQILLFLLTLVFAYKIAALVFDEKTGFYSMVVTAFFPTLLNYPSYILSETLFTFLLSVFVFSCTKIYFTDRLIYYFLAGVFIGIATLCKAVMFPFIVVTVFWAALLKHRPKGRLRMAVKLVSMILAFAFLVFPWMVRNYYRFGDFTLRAGSEKALCIKVQKLDYTAEDFKRNIAFIISERLGSKMFLGTAADSRDFLFKEDILVENEILPNLRDEGYTDTQIRNMMVSEIKKKPFKFAAVSFLDLLKMTQFTYLPLLIDQKYFISRVVRMPYGGLMLSAARALFRSLACVLILFSAVTLAIKRTDWRRWLFLVLLITYIIFMYSLLYGHGRYTVPLIPYFVMLSAPVIISITEKIKGARKCQK